MKWQDVRFWRLADMPTSGADVRFWGVKRTLQMRPVMSAFDPKRTSRGLAANDQKQPYMARV